MAMRRSITTILWAFCLVGLLLWGECASAADEASAAAARQILAATGVHGGLVVHLGCGDGQLTAALRANDAYLVQGLDADQAAVQAARRTVQRLGLYGKVSIDQTQGARLPYADNLVNLLVVEKAGSVSNAEMMRVLAPNGVETEPAFSTTSRFTRLSA
jgi:ribosomal protein L11 methylase PrmA